MSGSLPSEKSLAVNSVISEFSLNDFTEEQEIGRGGEGEVFRGYNGRLGKVAVKRLYRQVNKTDMNEVILLAKHSTHSNIIRLFGLLTPEEGYLSNSSTFCIGYIMEYMENGNLYNVIHSTSVKYDMEQVYSWIEKASSGLQYLHEKSVMHRDIKPQNILLGKSLDDLRISDFGWAKAVEPQTITSHTCGVGTVDYMAPELHKEIKYGKSADIYALTITFWEIIHRERPYAYMGGITLYNQINRILNGDRPNIQEELEISALLKRGWHNNPESRPKISEFIEFSRKKRPAQDLRKVVSQQNLPTQNEEQQNTSVLILGGSKFLDSIYLLDSKAQSWKKLSITLPMKIHGFGAVVLNEEIYIFGGFANQNSQQNSYKLKDDGSWIKLASMDQDRTHIFSSSLVYKGGIWAIGGNSREHLKSVEKYDIFRDKWTYMPEMNYARSNAAAAVFKDRIFVTGGWNEEILKSVEMFDPKLQKWILFCDLPIEVFGHTILISNSILSIFGGESESDELNSVWEMDIEDSEKKWTEKQSFKHPRAYFGIGKLSTEIIIFGGLGKTSEKTSEIFDGNGWIDGPKLSQLLPYFAYTSIPRSLEEKLLRKVVSQQHLQIQNEEEFNSPESKRRKLLAQNAVRTETKVEKQSGEQQNTSVLILGGGESLDSIYLLDSKAQSWKKLSITLPVKMRDFGAVVLNEEIYIFGGYANYDYKQDCYKLKNDGSWMELASLNQKRSTISSSSLVYKGDIWVIGGFDGDSALNSVEKYDISQDRWIYMPKMNYARTCAAAAVFKDRIFVTGGWNKERLKSVEMFDPKQQKWILFCYLPIELFFHTMLISNSTLSIFGGDSGSGFLNDVNNVWEMDIEDPEKKWTEKESFNRPRCGLGIGKLSNEIIIFGGCGGEETSEIFDGNEWIDGPKLPQDLTCFAYTSIPRSLEESFLKNLFSCAQNAVRTETKFEKQSGGQQNTSILVLGGYGHLNTIYLLDSNAQSWKELRITLPVGMVAFGAAVLNEEIYIFGGNSGGTYLQGCYKLNDNGSWMQLASMNQKRAFICNSSLVYKGDIWAIGGYSGDSRKALKSVEKYDISQDKWTYISEMNYARFETAAAVFKDRIFVTGGINEERLKSVEMFDPKLQKWLLFCDLPIDVFGHTILISNSTLSIFGGTSGSVRNSVWEMDIEYPEKQWTEKESFKRPRYVFGIGKLSNGIIMFGGHDIVGKTSEIFDGNEWIDGPRLPQRLSAFAYTSIPRSLEESFLRKCL